MFEQVESLKDILEPTVGQVVYVNDEKKYYRYDATEGWQGIKADDTLFTMNAYEMNKQIVGQLQILDKEIWSEKKKMITKFCNEMKNRFYMLLCREANYYTVFYRQQNLGVEYIADIVKECAETLGDVKAVDMSEDGQAIEIWVDGTYGVFAMYFFPYDRGVEICR